MLNLSRFTGKAGFAALFASGVLGLSAALPTPMIWFDMKDVKDGVVADASGNGHALTLGPTVEVVDDDLVGRAIRVTGSRTDYATFSCPVVTNTTIAFWINRDAKDSSILDGTTEKNNIPYILSTGYSGFGINYGRNQDKLSFIDQQNSPQTNFDGPSPARGRWHHVAFAIEYSDTGDFGTLTCRAYLDGGLVATTVQANNREMRKSGAGLQKPILFNNGANGERPTSGRYADIRFYDTCLNDLQIKELASNLFGPRLVMRYAFDEISDTTDANGRRTTPEATGLGTPMTLGKNLTLVDDGVDGKAVRFMSTTEICGKAVTPVFPLFERTYSVWVRSSSRRTELNAVVENTYPRLFDTLNNGDGTGGGYCIFGKSKDLDRMFQFMPAGNGTAAKAYTLYGVAELDTWSHLVVVEHADAEGKGRADIYVNGQEVAYQLRLAYDFSILKGSIAFNLGNVDYSGNRYFCGDLDDFRLYNYALTPDEVGRLYRGLARIDAGADFTAAGPKGVLHGVVGANAGDGYRKGYAGEIAWSQVSGEPAAILQPNAAETEVTLPAPGTYVFRLSITDLGVTKSDDVTVTCVAADAANQAPTVSVAASAQAITQPDSVTLTATVADDAKPAPAVTRVRWTKVSGPGGVWFDADDARETKASFGAAGTYVLACTADDGQVTASANVTVAVADRTDGKNLSSDLLHYFPLDGQGNPYSPDQGNIEPKKHLTEPNYNTLRYVPGKVGNGARAYAYAGEGARWTTGVAVGEVPMDDPNGDYKNTNLPPKNDFLTVSAWIRIDPTDTNLVNGKVVGANVVGQGFTFGLRYNEKAAWNATINEGGFTLYQQGRNGSTAAGNVAMYMSHYPVPSPSPVGRWMHVCAIWARTVSDAGQWEMWYDGVKQTRSGGSSGNACRGRVNTNPFNIGGMEYTGASKNNGALNAGGSYNANWPIGDSLTEFYSRTFPGVVDEVRVWTRKLTPAEIRYLAANPVIDANRGPSVDEPVAASRHPGTRKPTQVAVAAFADKLPAGGALTYTWSLLSGDASLVTIGDPSAASTTFTATKPGTYVLQLQVSDGERTVCSKPLMIDVVASGTVVIVK